MAIENNDEQIQRWLEAEFSGCNSKSSTRESGENNALKKQYRALFQMLNEEKSPDLSGNFNAQIMQKIELYQEKKSRFRLIASFLLSFAVVIPSFWYFIKQPVLNNWQAFLIDKVSSVFGTFNQDYFGIINQTFAGLNVSVPALLLAGFAIIAVIVFDELIFQKKKRIIDSTHLLSL
ncbi:MAG: hypothetical protein DWQ05_20535 [Calditrichaeota bacterium]|nr:MAG: hypothetical protein DWQ05_20535 [Calditrichota bacterium]